MPDPSSFRMSSRSPLVATALAAVLLAGCATGPRQDRAPATPYKGNAVWDISSMDADARGRPPPG